MVLLPFFWLLDTFIIWFTIETMFRTHLYITIPVALVISALIHYLWVRGEQEAANALSHKPGSHYEPPEDET